jgi:CBS domain-containing protein
MSTNVVSLHANDDLVHADEVMGLKRVRHLPVVEGKKLLGLVTHRDILRAQARIVAGLESKDETKFVPLTAKDLMTEKVLTTDPEAPAKEAARALLDNHFGCLPVVENDELVGIVTEVDFLRWSLDQLS